MSAAPPGRRRRRDHRRGRPEHAARRPREAGAETLEFTAVAGLVGAVLVLALRALGVVQTELRAQDDARTLARDAAVCERGGSALTLRAVDPAASADATAATARTTAGVVAVTVTLPAVEIVPDVAATAVTPRATVAMRLEPGCP